MPVFSATVVITTKNRKDDLRKAVASAISQTAQPEILVLDDGSTDGTSDMIRSEFPSVRLVRHEQSTGYIVARNECAELASAPILFSIDDDAIFSTPNVIAQTLTQFDHPKIGAVAIPFINILQDQTIRQNPSDTSSRWITSSFVGTAHALRKDVFLELGGYRGFLVHQGEEPDFCIRMLEKGFVVRLGNSDVIHHFESPLRNRQRMAHFGRRNDILFAWHNVPLIRLPDRLVSTTIGGGWYGLRSGQLRWMLWGLACGYGAIFQQLRQRDPVSLKTHRVYRMLRKRGQMPMEALG